MNKFIYPIASMVLLLWSLTSAATPNPRVKGTVKDINGEIIPFCNILFMDKADTLDVRGDISQIDGRFDIAIPAGDYLFAVRIIGYEAYSREISVSETTDMGEIVLLQQAIQIDAAVVRADMIRRRADGYLFSPGNSPIVQGRNSLELLNFAPGVWVDRDNGIKINGKGGTKVMINDRMLQLDGDELTNYLESINAEDIRSVEVIPDPGAQYDASSSGGILKITLKRSAMAGLTGSFSTNYLISDINPHRLRPSLNLEYRRNRLNLYTILTYSVNNSIQKGDEFTDYFAEKRTIENYLNYRNKYRSFAGRFGSVYELNDRQNVGIDVELVPIHTSVRQNSFGEIIAPFSRSTYENMYREDGRRFRTSISTNYKITLDSLGSSLMLVADYMSNPEDSDESSVSEELFSSDNREMFRQAMDKDREIRYYTLKADLTQYLSEKWQIETGMKFAYSYMDTELDYRDEVDGQWVSNTSLSDHYLYREGVLAAYVSARGKMGRWSLAAGLRAENTNLSPKSYIRPAEAKKQNYTDFFPSGQLNFAISEQKGHFITGGYQRKINRPGMNMLNPFRVKFNNYSYLVGNPDLKPSYVDNYNLSLVFGNLFTFNAGYNRGNKAIDQVVTPDPADPNVLLWQHQNINKTEYFIFSLSVPVNIFKWWRMSVDGFVGRGGNNFDTYSVKTTIYAAMMNNLFTMPKNWSAEVNGYYQSGFIEGNAKGEGRHAVNLSLRKGFLNNKLMVTAMVNNAFDNGNGNIKLKTYEEGTFRKTIDTRITWYNRSYGISIRYNFKAGKEVKVKKVVSGNEDEKSRD